MATYNSVALGKARGSVGGVRFSVWKGIPVASQKPETVANPRTPRQLSARSRISALVSIYKTIPNFTNIVWAFQAVKKSAYNAWLGAQNKDEYLSFDSSNICEGILDGEFQIANKETSLPPLSVSIGGGNIVLGFSGLQPNTNYSANIMGSNGISTFGEDSSSYGFVSTGLGNGTLTIPDNTLGFTPSSIGVALQNSVSGIKYAYYQPI